MDVEVLERDTEQKGALQRRECGERLRTDGVVADPPERSVEVQPALYLLAVGVMTISCFSPSRMKTTVIGSSTLMASSA